MVLFFPMFSPQGATAVAGQTSVSMTGSCTVALGMAATVGIARVTPMDHTVNAAAPTSTAGMSRKPVSPAIVTQQVCQFWKPVDRGVTMQTRCNTLPACQLSAVVDRDATRLKQELKCWLKNVVIGTSSLPQTHSVTFVKPLSTSSLYVIWALIP